MKEHLFIGRQEQLHPFNACLHADNSSKLFNIYGTAGIGKSYLAQHMQELAEHRAWRTIALDSNSFVQTPAGFCSHLLEQLDIEPGNEPGPDSLLIKRCLHKLNELAAADGLAIFIDTFEQLSHLEQWLREHFLSKLQGRVIIVITGRYPLSQVWFKLHPLNLHISSIPLANFSYEEVKAYLSFSGIADVQTVNRVWAQSQGHPFTVSMSAFSLNSAPGDDYELEAVHRRSLPYLVSVWLREVPTEQMRQLVECAAVLRHFNQDILTFVLKREVPVAEFHQLLAYSFVNHTERGWTFHPLMRESVINELQARSPQRVNEFRSRALLFYYDKLLSGNRQWIMPWEAYEFMNYMGDALVRAYMSWFTESALRFEPADRHQLEELLQYEHKARTSAKDTQLDIVDPQTSHRFRFTLTAEASLYTFRWLDFEQFLELGYDAVKILRGSNGQITALAIFIPINRKTLPFLLQNPRSAAYFSTLPPEERGSYEAAENDRSGWFINSIHMSDYSDPAISAAVTKLMHSLILTGERLISAPPPIPYFTRVFESLGFVKIESHGMHTQYDGVTPAYAYMLDTRGARLTSYIHGMLKKSGFDHLIPEEEKTAPVSTEANPLDSYNPPFPPIVASASESQSPETFAISLTSRQKEVAELLAQGLSNAQMAAKLYLSEYTVKKHLKTLFQKFEVTSRTQLLKTLLNHPEYFR